MPHKGSNKNYKSSPGHKKPAASVALPDTTRLRSPYRVSEKAGQALDDINVKRAASPGRSTGTAREILSRVGRRTIESVGGARRTARDLAGVNRELRKKRGK